jgi:hypothetical protein
MPSAPRTLGHPPALEALLFKLADADPGGVKFLLKLLDPCLQLLNGGPGSFISVADTPAVLDLGVFTRVAAVHRRQTTIGLLRLRRS